MVDSNENIGIADGNPFAYGSNDATEDKKLKDVEELNSPLVQWFSKNQGILYGVASGIIDATSDFSAQLSMADVTPLQVIFIRSFVQIPVFFALIFFRRAAIFDRDQWHLIFGTSIAWGISNIFYNFGLNLLSLFLVTIFVRLKCVSGILLSMIILKEKITKTQFFILLVVLLGVAISSCSFLGIHEEETIDTQKVIGCSLMICMSFFAGISGVFCKKVQDIDSIVLAFWQTLSSSFLSGVYLICTLQFTPISLVTFLIISSNGLLTLFYLYLLNKGLRLINPGIVFLAETSSIPSGLILQIAFFFIIPSYLGIIGAIVVIIALILLTFQEKIKTCVTNCFTANVGEH